MIISPGGCFKVTFHRNPMSQMLIMYFILQYYTLHICKYTFLPFSGELFSKIAQQYSDDMKVAPKQNDNSM